MYGYVPVQQNNIIVDVELTDKAFKVAYQISTKSFG